MPSRGLLLFFLGGLAAGNQALLLWWLGRYGILGEIGALQTTFSAERFAQILFAWGDEGRAAFLWHYFFDSYHPVLYGAFLGYALACWPPTGPRGRWMAWSWLPVMAAAGDAVENASQLLLVSGRVPLGSFWLPLGAAAACWKWMCVTLAVAALAWGVARVRRAPAP